MLITILITAAVATPVGYLVGAMVAGSKVVDAIAEAQELRTRLDRLTDRDERGRFVRREIDNGARPKEGRFKL